MRSGWEPSDRDQKSGYGLDEASELKMLRVIRRLQDHFPIPGAQHLS